MSNPSSSSSYSGLSQRGHRVANIPKPPFSAILQASMDKLYDPVTRPDGIVNISVAENKLVSDLVLSKLQEVGPCLTASGLAYNPNQGSQRLRKAIANHLSKRVAKCPIDADKLMLTTGATSTLWLLTSMLTDVGEGVMVPAPFYHAYERDFTALLDSKLVVVPAGPDGSSCLDVNHLSRAKEEAAKGGVKSRAIVITNPSNPTGEVVSINEVLKVIEWASKEGLDVLVNEVYASTAHADSGFTSVLEAYRGQLPPHVHFIWSLSKDFGMNGLRCGCFYSCCPSVLQAAIPFGVFLQVAGTVQAQISSVLEDEAWVDYFLEESRRMIIESHKLTVDTLRSIGADVKMPKGSLFVWVNLGAWAKTAGSEMNLFKYLVEEGILICPGQSSKAATEGWYRLCPPATPKDHLVVGLKRLEVALKKLSKSKEAKL